MHSYQYCNEATSYAIEADSAGDGLKSKIVLRRITVNGGTNGTITLEESDTTEGSDATTILEIDVPASFTPFTLEYDIVVTDTLIVTLTAATDVTVVFDRIP